MSIETLLPKVYTEVMAPVIALLLGVALAVFIWGLVEFIYKSGSDEGRAKGKKHIIWGIIGIFIMISVFGITRVIVDSLGHGVTDPKPAVIGE